MKTKIFFLVVIFSLKTNTFNAQIRFNSIHYSEAYQKILNPNNSIKTQKVKLLSNEEKIEGLSKVWAEAKYGFANFDLVPNLNWDNAYLKFIPKVIKTKNNQEYYNILKEFNQLLHDGHSRIMEPDYLKKLSMNSIPIKLKYLNNKVLVREIQDKKYIKKIKLGWEVIRIDGIPIQKYISDKVAPYISYSSTQDSIARIYAYELFSGKENSSSVITFRDQKNIMHNFKLKRTYNLSQKEPLTFKWIDSEIAYVGIPNFASEDIVRQFDSLFNEIQKSKYLIIDIRENGGGNSNNGYEILGRLTDSTFATNSTVFKKYNPANRSWDNNAFEIEVLGYDWKPYKKNSYRNQVVLLTSALTYSAAEDFTVAFKYMKRGLIIGSPTGGSTGNPMSYDLPGGAKGFVCSKRELMPDGTEFIGKGIQPDFYVKETQQGICKGEDEVINEAIRIIHENNNQNKSNEK